MFTGAIDTLRQTNATLDKVYFVLHKFKTNNNLKLQRVMGKEYAMEQAYVAPNGKWIWITYDSSKTIPCIGLRTDATLECFAEWYKELAELVRIEFIEYLQTGGGPTYD